MLYRKEKKGYGLTERTLGGSVQNPLSKAQPAIDFALNKQLINLSKLFLTKKARSNWQMRAK